MISDIESGKDSVYYVLVFKLSRFGINAADVIIFIAEDETEIIRIIYDKFVNTTMERAVIATFLNNSGIRKNCVRIIQWKVSQCHLLKEC